MAVPSGMQKAVDKLRELGGAARNDIFGGTVYWTDDQLLDVLYENMKGYTDYELYAVISSNLVFQYNASRHHYLDVDNLTVDGTDETPTVDVVQKVVTFLNPVESTVTITAPVYDLNLAAAAVWKRKAAQRYDAIRVKAGANQLFLEQEYEHCLQMAEQFENATAKRFRRKLNWLGV